MGRKGNWFSAVKRVLSPESKEKKDKKNNKSKKNWPENHKKSDLVFVSEEITTLPVPASTPFVAPVEDVKLTEAENEQSKHAYSMALATAAAAEAAVAAAQAAAEVVRLTAVVHYPEKSKEEIAVIKIQTAFRGYLARRALRALKGLVRLKSMIQWQSVKQQATSTLKCMQTLARVQAQIREGRIRMSQENHALQRQLQQKREKELEKFRASQVGEEWNNSIQSKEQIEAKLQHKQEATMRRERALAYAFSHQNVLKNSSKSANPTFMDPNNPHWGWSWLERWMAARPWENQSTVDNFDHSSLKSAASRAMSIGKISRAYSLRDLNKPSPTAHQLTRLPSHKSPSTPPSRAPSSSSVTGKIRPPNRRGNPWSGDEDSTNMHSARSERYRRYSIAGSSVGDTESLASLPSVPSYMAPTKLTNTSSRPSPLGADKNGTPDKVLMNSAKKRLSFHTSPAGPRRHSGPPRMESTSTKDIEVHTDEKVTNGIVR